MPKRTLKRLTILLTALLPVVLVLGIWWGGHPSSLPGPLRDVFVDDKVRKYVLDIIQATRQHEDVALGGSPRATIALFRTAQALAAVSGRNFVLPDDVKRMAPPVLGHRIILKPESRLRKLTPASVLNEILMDVSVPVMPRPGDKDEWAD